VNGAIVRTSALMLGGLVLALGLSLVLARRMTQPIRALRQGADRFADGDLHHRIEISSRDELEDVADRFNAMADQLGEAQTMLEHKVEERTRELEVANLAKTRFLAAAGHDLRQPVHAVGLLMSSLRLKLERNDLRELAAKADLAIDDMRELLDNLLDMSRLEAGTTIPKLQHIPVSRLIEQAEFAGGPEADGRGLDFRVVRSEQMVLSDPVMLGRIVLNLVSNALRNTQSGKVLLGCRRRGRALSIEIWDTGVGIPEDRLGDIFGEFFKLQSAALSPGLGLGLYIVKGLANQLGHTLDVSSQVGKGSVFRISVPLVDMSASADVPSASEPRANLLAGRTVLVVDDAPTVLSAITTVLDGWGCRVLAAASGEEALALFSAHRDEISVVLCDYEIPGSIDGLEVLGRIKATGKHVSSILVTGDTSPLLQNAAEQAGYLTLHKPVQPNKLHAVMTQLLADRTADQTNDSAST
jgi:signal transduction histidine kinase/ActR/RegA family two-component response regulator